MKKIFILFMTVFFITGIDAFSLGKKAEETAVGYIKYYGNAPFEFAGFETVDGYLFTIQVKKNANFSIEDIEKEKGSLLELTGKIDKSKKNGLNVLKDGIFVVSQWKKL